MAERTLRVWLRFFGAYWVCECERARRWVSSRPDMTTKFFFGFLRTARIFFNFEPICCFRWEMERVDDARMGDAILERCEYWVFDHVFDLDGFNCGGLNCTFNCCGFGTTAVDGILPPRRCPGSFDGGTISPDAASIPTSMHMHPSVLIHSKHSLMVSVAISWNALPFENMTGSGGARFCFWSSETSTMCQTAKMSAMD